MVWRFSKTRRSLAHHLGVTLNSMSLNRIVPQICSHPVPKRHPFLVLFLSDEKNQTAGLFGNEADSTTGSRISLKLLSHWMDVYGLEDMNSLSGTRTSIRKPPLAEAEAFITACIRTSNHGLVSKYVNNLTSASNSLLFNRGWQLFLIALASSFARIIDERPGNLCIVPAMQQLCNTILPLVLDLLDKEKLLKEDIAVVVRVVAFGEGIELLGRM